MGCTFGTGHGCSIGSYTTGVHDITVDSCTFNSTTTGVRIKSNRGRSGIVQNITYSNITMTNVTNAINITCYYPKTPASPTTDTIQTVTSLTPYFKNITLKNITAIGSDKAGEWLLTRPIYLHRKAHSYSSWAEARKNWTKP